LFEVARVGREGVTSVLDLRCPGTGPGFENLRFGWVGTGQKENSFGALGLVFARASFAAAVIAVFCFSLTTDYGRGWYDCSQQDSRGFGACALRFVWRSMGLAQGRGVLTHPSGEEAIASLWAAGQSRGSEETGRGGEGGRERRAEGQERGKSGHAGWGWWGRDVVRVFPCHILPSGLGGQGRGAWA
jgi:hypothetical protein